MIGGLQIHGWGMAFGASCRGFDVVVANEAIFHVREIGFGEWANGGLEATVASLTRILCDQVGTKPEDIDFVWRAQILPAVDCAGDDWC